MSIRGSICGAILFCLAATSASAREALPGDESNEPGAEGRQDSPRVLVGTDEEVEAAPSAAASFETPETPRPSVLPRPAPGGRWGPFTVGVRAGALIPFGARHASYSETVQAGVFAAGSLWKVAFEIGVDAYRLEAKDVHVTADVMSGRIDVLLEIRAMRSERSEAYCHFGPRVLVDFADTRWGETTELAAAVGGGVGVRRRGGGWDARFSVDRLIGSANIMNFLNVNVGFTF